MATKHVQETLGQFEDWKFFSLLEEKKEGEDFSNDDKKLDQEDEKDGLAVIQKLKDNLERFKSAAGDKILKFKEFWEENQGATDGFDDEGDLYKLWDSNYVAGVLSLPDEALSKDELDAAIADVDDDDVGGEDDKEDDDDKDDKDKDEDKDKDDKPEPGKKGVNPFEKKEDKEDDDDKEEDEDDDKVDENAKPKGEDFPLNEAEELEKEGELPAEDVVTPDEESSEEKEETDAEGFTGFEAPGGDELADDDVEAEDQFGDDDEVSVEDGEAVELDGDLDGDGTEEGGMEFADEGGMNDCFVVYDMNGERDEVFRTKSPKVIEAFKDFYENIFKAAIREQIQKFKQAQEEKKAEAERAAKEAIRAEKKGKLDKFMKD